MFVSSIGHWRKKALLEKKLSEEMKAIVPYRWEINPNCTHASAEKEIIYEMVKVLRILRILVFLTLKEMLINIQRRRRNM